MHQKIQSETNCGRKGQRISQKHNLRVVTFNIVGAGRLASKVTIDINVILSVSALGGIVEADDTAANLLVALQVEGVVVHVVVESAVTVVLVAGKSLGVLSNCRPVHDVMQSDGKVRVDIAK